jgi:hypothetical protein
MWIEAAENFVLRRFESLRIQQIFHHIFIATSGVPFQLGSVGTESGTAQQVCHQ